MKAMILAAGLGNRMRPLTDSTPKPLLRAGRQTLLDYHIERLLELGINDIVINTHWLGEQISKHVKINWATKGNFRISHEPELLETAGGIVNALPTLESPNDDAFLLINGDIFFEDSLEHFLTAYQKMKSLNVAHILLTENPQHNTSGDFSIGPAIHEDCFQVESSSTHHNTHTYCGIGLYRPSLFRDLTPGPRPLGPILKEICQRKELSGSLMKGAWVDVGTPERLEQLRRDMAESI